MKPVIYLHKLQDITLKKGHPWIFPKAIAKTEGYLTSGQLVKVFNSAGEYLGLGVFNEHSLYRVRMLVQAELGEEAALEDIIRLRLVEALKVRHSLCLPNPKTNAYRLFNSEGDGLSGLTLDSFNQITVVLSSAYWVQANKELISKIIKELINTEIIWLTQAKSLVQDGWTQDLNEPIAAKTTVLEEGIVYEVDFADAQKTGLFLDQRENHQRIAALAANKKVLDLYCYTGGFALHTAKAGAIKVTAVDSSLAAITQAKTNAALNQLQNVEFIKADARDYLQEAGLYDLIILDPPKLVPSRKHLERAKNYYRFLHRELFKVMQTGALLLTCNCSSALATQEFTSLVVSQAQILGRRARVLGVYGPASCHPTLPAFPEGNYLTAVLLAVL